MKKVVSMFMALVVAFAIGPNVVVRAEEDKAAKAEKTVLEAIDLVERCVGNPGPCKLMLSALDKKSLGEKIEPILAALLESAESVNYAFLFSKVGEKNIAKYPLLKALTEADYVSFSQVCDFLKNLAKSMAENSFGDRNTKKEL